MTTRRVFYRWDLTPHERAALMTVISDYILTAEALEVSVDAASGEEIEIGSLLKRVIDLDPTTAKVEVELVNDRPAGAPWGDMQQAMQAMGEAFELHKPPGVELVAILYDRRRVIGTGSDPDQERALKAAEEWAALERQTRQERP